MARLSDLNSSNRQKREFALSGQATTGDIPYLYALMAGQDGANAPSGIGQQQAGAAEGGAPNPQSFGGGAGAGGASGAADTGMPGAGQTGFGQEGDEFYRGIAAGQGSGGAEDRGLNRDFDPNAFADPTLPGLVGDFAPFPLDWVGKLGAAGMRVHNAGLVDDYLSGIGLEGLSGWQQAGAALGPTLGNPYGEGTQDALRQALDSSIERTQAGSEDYIGGYSTTNQPGGAWGQGAGVGGVPTPEQATASINSAQGTSSYGGAGGGPSQSSGYSSDMASERGRQTGLGMTRDAREAAREGSGGAEGGGGRGGGGGFGCFVAGTMVLLADGSEKPIEAIRPGDTVAAFDGLGELQPRRVAHVMHYQDREPLTVRFAGGSVRVTAEHPFLVPSGEYVRAGDLAAGGHVVDADGEGVEVLAVEPATDTADVFNFEVDELHTYIAAGLRVHNIKHDGGIIGEDRVPDQSRGDVHEILQEGEGVLTADAVEMLGPDFVHTTNALARMMRARGGGGRSDGGATTLASMAGGF